MPLKFKKNGTTYTGFPPYESYNEDYIGEIEEYETDHTPANACNICYKRRGKTYYAPCLATVNQSCITGKFRFTWDSSRPSIAVKKNGTTYHLVNVRKYNYTKTEGTFTSITYTRAKQSNGYYKFTFTVKYKVKACTLPVGVQNGNWTIDLQYGPSDMTYNVTKSGTYSGTITPSSTSLSSEKTCTFSITATGGNTEAKERVWFFAIHSTEADVDWQDGSYYAITTESWQETYSIPAGTYTPSAFRSLIEQYISNNGNRTCSNTFTAKVNGQTITVNSGSKIYYQVLSSSPQGNARSVYFGTAPQSGFAPAIASNSSTNGFTNGKAYVVYNSGGGFNWTEAYKNYANYSITIGTGINFS